MARAVLANNRGFASTFGVVDQDRVAGWSARSSSTATRTPARRAGCSRSRRWSCSSTPTTSGGARSPDEALAFARTGTTRAILPYVLRDHFHAVWSADTLEDRRAHGRAR